MIDHYLDDLAAELARRGLRGRRAARLCAEARDHLLELEAEHGEAQAVTRFGSPRTLAIEAAHQAYPLLLIRSTLLFLAALPLFVLPLYAIPENTLPPAPWDARPAYLTWKLYVSGGAFGVAVLAGLVALAAAWWRRRDVALLALTLAGGSLAGSAVIGAIGAIQWAEAVPGAGTTLVLTLGSTTLLGCASAAALASAVRVHRLARDLPR